MVGETARASTTLPFPVLLAAVCVLYLLFLALMLRVLWRLGVARARKSVLREHGEPRRLPQGPQRGSGDA